MLSNIALCDCQAFAQVPNATVWYGPDSYMGANLAAMFRQMSDLSDDEIAAVHPLHNKESIRSLLPRLHYYRVSNNSPFPLQYHQRNESTVYLNIYPFGYALAFSKSQVELVRLGFTTGTMDHVHIMKSMCPFIN